MHPQRRRFGSSLLISSIILVTILLLALNGTTWAAPGAQGTVPTPKSTQVAPAGQPTGQPGGEGNNGGDNQNGNDQGNNQEQGNGETGTATEPTAVPVVPLAPTSGSVCSIADTGAQCNVAPLVLVVPAGAMPSGSALAFEGPFAQPPCPPSEAGITFLNKCYRVNWIGTDTQPLSTLSAPVTSCFAYSAQDVAHASNQPDNLLIGLAGADGRWSLVKPTVDQPNSRVCATLDHPFTWQGLFTGKPTLLPDTGADLTAPPFLLSFTQAFQEWALRLLVAIQSR